MEKLCQIEQCRVLKPSRTSQNMQRHLAAVTTLLLVNCLSPHSSRTSLSLFLLQYKELYTGHYPSIPFLFMTSHQFCTSICQVLSKGMVPFCQVLSMLDRLVLSYIHLTSVINYQFHSFTMSYSSFVALSGFSGCFDLFDFSSH